MKKGLIMFDILSMITMINECWDYLISDVSNALITQIQLQ